MLSGPSRKGLQVDSRKLRWVSLSSVYSQAKNPQIRRQAGSDKAVCCIFNRDKNILLHNVESTQKPIQLMFAESYGRVLDYCVTGAGYLVVLFELGQVSQLSLLNDELSQEINSKKLFSRAVTQYCWSADRGVLAVGSGGLIKFFDVNEFVELKRRRLRFGVDVKSLHSLGCKSALLVLLTNGQLNSVLSESAGFKVEKTRRAGKIFFAAQKSYNVLHLMRQACSGSDSKPDSEDSTLERAVFMSPDQEISDFRLAGCFLFVLGQKEFSLHECTCDQVKPIWNQPIKKKVIDCSLAENGSLILR